MKYVNIESEGKCIIGSCMDKISGERNQGFYEVKAIKDNSIHCRWIYEDEIYKEED